MKYDVFISYSSKDQKVVEAMCAYLEQHKVRCFVAYRDIPKGVVWAKAIVEALDESRMMVVVFSEEFNLSDQVDREIELASEDKKPILTFRINDTMFKGAKKYYLKNINWIDAFPHPEKVFDALLDNVCKLIGKLECQTDQPEEETSVQTSVDDAESLCPCGSGRLFKDCHGSDKLRVGDYYNVDGKEGVVFWLDSTGNHGKIVSMDDTQLPWCTVAEDGLVTGSSDYEDGMKNLNVIMKIDDWREKYPAFAWCADHGDGWYLPAINELKVLLLDPIVRSRVNNALFKKMVSTIPPVGSRNWYWSSTEFERWSSWDINMRDGKATASLRISMCKVLAVTAF